MPTYPAHRPGYSYFLHRHHEDEYRPEELGERTSASGMVFTMEHSGTHIDAVCHQSDGLTMYGGVPVDRSVQTPKGFTRHGVEEIPPLVTPGVLLDVAALHGVDVLEPGYGVTADDLAGCCNRQNAAVNGGDVVLVRTGNARNWEDTERYLDGPGVSSGGSGWLADRSVRAVGADNLAWDVIGVKDPGLGCTLPGHLILLARRGIYIIENLNLEELAVAAGSGESRFLFVCAPLKLVGATGSPVRPLAILSSGIVGV